MTQRACGRVIVATASDADPADADVDADEEVEPEPDADAAESCRRPADAASTPGPGATVLEQAQSAATSVPRMALAARVAPWKAIVMWVILLEAFGALVLILLIVWWTMFAGRRHGERRDDT